jgi:hypothetical protein
MEQTTQAIFASWESFYVIVGSAGAALTGLQFVVIVLSAGSRRQSTAREISAFGTPTVVHFCAVLLISAILSAPWHSLSKVAVALGACGLGGIAYGIIVARRARTQTGYRAVFEDWLWHAVLPLIAYAMLLVAAIFLPGYRQRDMFVIAATALLLLFIGIHNAWDAVTYIALEHFEKTKQE